MKQEKGIVENITLPNTENLLQYWDNLPKLAPELIKGVLRKGHKMLFAGSSKAGKSFALISLSIAIAEGVKWLGFDCTQGKVLYINLELDSASCLHRFKNVYKSLEIPQNSVNNIDIWNLRGKTIPMDKLVLEIIKRVEKGQYQAIIIDPIYKVLTGDENSAEKMAYFTNQFDKITTELGCSVIYCHHHSKGSQGNKKTMDRASGSGVFARDTDALLDITELEVSTTKRLLEIEKMEIYTYIDLLKNKNIEYYNTHIKMQNDMTLEELKKHVKIAIYDTEIIKEHEYKIRENIEKIEKKTAWKLEGTLREFPKFSPKYLWFNYPIHEMDKYGVLAVIDEENKFNYEKATETRKEKAQEKKISEIEEFEKAVELLNIDKEKVTRQEIANYLKVSIKTINRRLKETKKYDFDKNTNTIIRIKED